MVIAGTGIRIILIGFDSLPLPFQLKGAALPRRPSALVARCAVCGPVDVISCHAADFPVIFASPSASDGGGVWILVIPLKAPTGGFSVTTHQQIGVRGTSGESNTVASHIRSKI